MFRQNELMLTHDKIQNNYLNPKRKWEQRKKKC